MIDKALLRLLGWRVGTYVNVETDGRTVILQRSGLQDADVFEARREEIGAGPQADSLINRGCAAGTVTETELKRLVMRAPKISDSLIHGDVPFETVRDLFHKHLPDADLTLGPTRGWLKAVMPYSIWAENLKREVPSAADIATMQRFEALAAHHRQSWFAGSWEDSVEAALEAVPMVREPGYIEPEVSPAPRQLADKPRGSLLDQLLGGDDCDESFDDAYDQSVSS